MVDKIISELNQQIADKFSKKQPGPAFSSFEDILSSQRNQLAMDKLAESVNGDKPSDMQVLSGQDVELQWTDAEISQQTQSKPTGISDLFATINNDMLSMDSAIEVLASGQVKFTRSQLLAYQHAMGTTSIGIDLYSKLVHSISQNLNTLLQTNLG